MRLRQLQAIRIHIGDDDVSRSGVTHHRGSHETDRPGPGDEHVLAEHIERQGRVDRVAERIEDRLHIARNVRIVDPNIGHRHGDVFGEGAGPLHADPLRVLAQMTPAGQAVAAVATDDVPLAADDLAGMEILDVGADLDDAADELVTDDQRHRDGSPSPGVPLVDVQIGAADAGAQHLDEYVVDADGRHRRFVEPQTGFRLLLDEGGHGFHNGVPSGTSFQRIVSTLNGTSRKRQRRIGRR